MQKVLFGGQMLTDQFIEIDLYARLRQEPRFMCYDTLEELVVLIPHLRRTVALPLASTQQRYGRRMWFLCRYCNHRVQKLYIQPRHFNAGYPIACRKCHRFKYLSQYRKDAISRCDVSKYKLARLESQKRRYWYSDRPTQFGRRYQKLREETKTFWDIIAEIQREAPELLAQFSRR